MRRRRVLILLGLGFFALQSTTIAIGYLLAPADSQVFDTFVSLLAVVAFGLIDLVIVRFLYGALERLEQSYSDEAVLQTERILEDYRRMAREEDGLVRQLSSQIEEELDRAHQAVAQGDSQQVDEHMRASLQIASQLRPPCCDNAAIAAVLEAKRRQCEAAGVRLETSAVIPEVLALPETEVASIVFNLVDNALHECEQLIANDNKEEPCIHVRAHVRAGQLIIQVDNPCRPESSPKLRRRRLPRNPAEPHGWGMGIVRAIAERHRGLAEFEKKDGLYVASVMLPIPEAA